MFKDFIIWRVEPGTAFERAPVGINESAVGAENKSRNYKADHSSRIRSCTLFYRLLCPANTRSLFTIHHIIMSLRIATTALAFILGANAQYTATYDPNNLPQKTENGQVGTNQCGEANSQTSLCQNVYVNGPDDFCLWGPQQTASIGNVEGEVVAYCTKPGRGTRLFPDGTILSAHFLETPDYIQITGTGVFTNIGVIPDGGGELDPHGAEGTGNPIGGLVFSNVWTGGSGAGQQIHEWTNFMSESEYCIRVCKDGPMAPTYCGHVYDINGCQWNIPGRYDDGFERCQADNTLPMGLYPQPDGSTSTYSPRASPVPTPHPAAASSNCQTFESTALFNGLPAAPASASSSTTTSSSSSSSISSTTPRTTAQSTSRVSGSSSSHERPQTSSPAPTGSPNSAPVGKGPGFGAAGLGFMAVIALWM